MTSSSPQRVPNIEALFQPTHDEGARQQFVASLRKHAIIDMRADLARDYQECVAPELAARGAKPADWRAIERAMEKRPSYRFYSTVRYHAQEMCYQSVQPTIERALPAMIETSRSIAADNPHGGTLRLAENFEVPRYVSALDVHLIPGCFHTEHTIDDVAQGAVTAFGGKVFTGQHPYRKRPGVVAESISHWLKLRYPDFKPRRILDMGTTSGKNLAPFAAVFPQAELHGIDVAAPTLRFGHALAAHEGVPIHFSQQNAEATDFPDGHFDLIVSSFFFHEVSSVAVPRILRECARLLAPGGMMVHMELPNEAAVGAYENFFWNWDIENNNEPHYGKFRASDPFESCVAAGFARNECFAHRIPDYASFGAEKLARFVRGELEAPPHGAGGWFVFGARKLATT